MPSPLATLPLLEVETRAQWRAWLQAHHTTATGVWLVTYKKATGHRHLPYADAVEEALCFGWIDSKPGTVDAERSKLLYTPRKPKSVWSAVNKERIERLLAVGQMTTAGIAAVERARANGSWDALVQSDALQEPPALQEAFAANAAARKHFDAFPPSTRKQLLAWIWDAKTDATRAKRIAETVSKAAENIRANQWQKKG